MSNETLINPQKEPGVQSIRRAFSILDAVSLNPEGLTLAQLSKIVGLHTSTTFHLCKTMVGLGILRQEKSGKSYHIGARLFGLAAGAADEIELVKLARPILAELAITSGENSHIAVPLPDGVIIIEKCDGSAQVRMYERIGSVRPLHATAIGKAILSGWTEAELAAFTQNSDLARHTPKTITDPDRLITEIMQVRENGIAYDDAEYNNEARCLAAPVFDFNSRIIGTIGISGPVWRIGLQDLPRLGKAVKVAANALSDKLGYVGTHSTQEIDQTKKEIATAI